MRVITEDHSAALAQLLSAQTVDGLLSAAEVVRDRAIQLASVPRRRGSRVQRGEPPRKRSGRGVAATYATAEGGDAPAAEVGTTSRYMAQLETSGRPYLVPAWEQTTERQVAVILEAYQ